MLYSLSCSFASISFLTKHYTISKLELFLWWNVILDIIIETSISSANKHNFSVEHLFKDELSPHDFWLTDNTQPKDVNIVKLKASINKQLLIFKFFFYFINKYQNIQDTHLKLVLTPGRTRNAMKIMSYQLHYLPLINV